MSREFVVDRFVGSATRVAGTRLLASRPRWLARLGAPLEARGSRSLRAEREPERRPAEISRDFVERTLRGRQPDALQRRRARASRRHSIRSSDSARCAPRLVGTSAWISSMMTVSSERSASRAFEVSSRYRDSGVVIRMSAGSRWNRARSIAGVSPVRIAIDRQDVAIAPAAARLAMPASGARRLRSMSTARALRGEMYSTRQRWPAAGAGSNISRLMHHRKAVSVLPLPVGARIRVDSPARSPASPDTGAASASRTSPGTIPRPPAERARGHPSRAIPPFYGMPAPARLRSKDRNGPGLIASATPLPFKKIAAGARIRQNQEITRVPPARARECRSRGPSVFERRRPSGFSEPGRVVRSRVLPY